MSGHTPGPWVARQMETQEWRIDAPDGDPELGYRSWDGLAEVYGCDDAPLEGAITAEANARLIAAAPDLLDELECSNRALTHVTKCVAWFRENHSTCTEEELMQWATNLLGPVEVRITHNSAAIARTTGETP